MSKVIVESDGEPFDVDLKDPTFAALLAWLWPGAGHLYQGRSAKGALFMICILGTFFFGLWLGEGHVVYASWKPNDKRLPYLCQIGAGTVALPALVQSYRVRSGRDPLWNGLMAPPQNPEHPHGELAGWNKRLHHYFELGTVFTMIAGLLNVLAIYDAFGGPVQLSPEEEKKKRAKKPDEAASTKKQDRATDETAGAK